MTVSLRYAARSDVGLVRSNNQDSAYAGPHLLVVADGMGGHAGGDVASRLAVAALAPLDHAEHGSEQALSDLERSVERARRDLVRASEADPDLAGMGTTVTALLRSGNTLVMAHLGDSRAYLLRDGVLTQVTVDHTFVQHLVDTGRISPDEAEHHPQRNVVMRVLGDFDVDLTPDLSVREARLGDRWLLCSDGMSGFVPPEQISQVLEESESPDEAADMLITLAMAADSTDNITVIVADVVENGAPEGTVQVVGAAATADRTPLTTILPDDPSDGAGTEPAGRTDEADDNGEDVDDSDARPAPRRRTWLGALVALVVLAGLGYAGWWGYGWTQRQYFVGVSEGEVAVYRGIPASAGPVTLATPIELTGTAVDELPDFWADRLDGTIRAGSLTEARERADRLIAEAAPEPTPAPATSPSPRPTPPPAPTPKASPTGAPARSGAGG